MRLSVWWGPVKVEVTVATTTNSLPPLHVLRIKQTEAFFQCLSHSCGSKGGLCEGYTALACCMGRASQLLPYCWMMLVGTVEGMEGGEGVKVSLFWASLAYTEYYTALLYHSKNNWAIHSLAGYNMARNWWNHYSLQWGCSNKIENFHWTLPTSTLEFEETKTLKWRFAHRNLIGFASCSWSAGLKPR